MIVVLDESKADNDNMNLTIEDFCFTGNDWIFPENDQNLLFRSIHGGECLEKNSGLFDKLKKSSVKYFETLH